MPIKRLAFFSIIVTYILIVFGGYVASSNSGMGCGPDWPLCNGLVIPILKGATLIEFTHRVIGALLGILSFILFMVILKSNVAGKVRQVAWGMLVLLAIQVLLGAVVVFLDTPANIVSIHLIIAMCFLFSLIWILRNSEQGVYHRHSYITLGTTLPKTVSRHLNNIIILLILTLAFGAYIKHMSYGLACSWIDCNDSFLPLSTPELLQTIHRGLAVASAVYIFVLAYWSFAKKWDKSLQKRLTIAVLTVIVQILIGIVTVETTLSIPWAVLHLAIGTAVFASISEARIYLGSAMVKSSIKLNEVSQYQSMD